MGRKINISNQNKSIEEILEWYRITENSLYENEKLIITNRNTSLNKFYGETPEQVKNEFKYVKDELDKMVCLDMLSAIEAALKVDYIVRAKGKKKDNLSKCFRSEYSNVKERVSLERTILSGWKRIHPEHKDIIGQYKELLKYRNWLAHGRLWEEKMICDVDIVYHTCDTLKVALSLKTPLL